MFIAIFMIRQNQLCLKSQNGQSMFEIVKQCLFLEISTFSSLSFNMKTAGEELDIIS